MEVFTLIELWNKKKMNFQGKGRSFECHVDVMTNHVIIYHYGFFITA